MAGVYKSIKDNFLTYFTISFALVWLFVVGVDYVNKHPAYAYAFQYFRYTGLCIQIIVVGAAILTFRKLLAGKAKIPFNGISFLILGLILTYLIIGSHKSLVNFKINSADQMQFLGVTLKSAIQLILFGVVCRSAGQWIYQKFLNGKVKSMYLLDLGLGLMLLVFGMFILGMFKVLNEWTVIIWLLVLSVLNIKGLLKLLKDLLFKSQLKKEWSTLGHISVYLTFVFILINLVSVQSPFPSGFDSRNYYMNISNLVAGQGALINGYPPYNGSLINALGLILFDQIELSLSISLSGVILVLLITYRIAIDKLKFDKNRAAFLVTLLAVIPAIVNQMYIELKVDFMLLFFQLLAVYYLFEIDKKYLRHSIQIKDYKYLALKLLPVGAFLGILLGFGMGIKMINLFLVIAIFVLIMWDKDNNWSGLGMICLGLMVFLIGGIDEMSGLRNYHNNVGTLGIGLGLTGVILLAVGLYFHRHSTLRRVVFSGLVAIFLLITISPWVIKNYIDTGSANPKTVLMGSSPGPKLSLRKMVKNYKE